MDQGPSRKLLSTLEQEQQQLCSCGWIFLLSLSHVWALLPEHRGRLEKGRCLNASALSTDAQLLVTLCCQKVSLDATVLLVGNVYPKSCVL